MSHSVFTNFVRKSRSRIHIKNWFFMVFSQKIYLPTNSGNPDYISVNSIIFIKSAEIVNIFE